MSIIKFFENDSCVICFEDITPYHVYAMIDSPGETGKYHVKCIEKWINKSTNGVLTQTPIEKINLMVNEQPYSHMKLIMPDHDYDEDICCIIL